MVSSKYTINLAQNKIYAILLHEYFYYDYDENYIEVKNISIDYT